MSKKIVIIGSGGLGREVAWLVERINKENHQWNLLGFIDDNAEQWGATIQGYKVLGNRNVLEKLGPVYVICAIANTIIREKIANEIRKKYSEIQFATLLDPSSVVSDTVNISAGVIILPNVVVSVDTVIGEHTIIDYGCTIGHDTVLESFTTIYPGSNIAGSVIIGSGSEIGTGAQIIQGKTIGAKSIIGAGAVVIRDTPGDCTAVGCPAKLIKQQGECI